MHTIKVVRERGYYGKFRAMKLVVDGQTVGSIKDGQTIEINIPDDAEEIFGKMDWGKTSVISLGKLEVDGAVVFEPYFSFNILRMFGIFKIPVRVTCR